MIGGREQRCFRDYGAGNGTLQDEQPAVLLMTHKPDLARFHSMDEADGIAASKKAFAVLKQPDVNLERC